MAVKDKLEVTGTYKEYYEFTELDSVSFVKTKGANAEGYESMLVQVDAITGGDAVKTTGTTPVAVGFKDNTSGQGIGTRSGHFFCLSPPALPKYT